MQFRVAVVSYSLQLPFVVESSTMIREGIICCARQEIFVAVDDQSSQPCTGAAMEDSENGHATFFSARLEKSLRGSSAVQREEIAGTVTTMRQTVEIRSTELWFVIQFSKTIYWSRSKGRFSFDFERRSIVWSSLQNTASILKMFIQD